MGVLKGIWFFLNSRVFVYILLLSAILYIVKIYNDYKDLKNEYKTTEQNLIAKTDSLIIERTKSGGLQASIAGYIASENQLKELNRSLYDESKKQKGQILSLNNIVFQLKQNETTLNNHISNLESIMGKPIQMNDNTYIVPWELKYVWDSINYDIYKGQTQVKLNVKPDFVWKNGMSDNQLLKNAISISHDKTMLLEKTSQMELTFGQKIEDNQLRVFVKTNYPGFTPKSLEGVLIDPNSNAYIKRLMKKKQWFPQTWSVGVGASTGLNVLTGKPYIGVGLNLNYNILQW